MSNPKEIGYFVFDVESAVDGQLVADLRFTGEELSPQAAVARFRKELFEKNGSDFVPYTYHFPISVVVAKVRHDYSLADIVILDDPEFRPHVITDHFWRGWEGYGFPTFVSFNGRSFDMPLMELSAFRYGLSAAAWFNDQGRSFEQPRNRYNTTAHLDVQDIMVNFGATRFSGGLDLAASILGKPGKMNVRGDMVQDMYDEGKIAEINDYCRCDVLDTYFVFLRTRVIIGKITIEREQEIVAQTKEWMQGQVDDSPAYAAYLDRWQDWHNPWTEDLSTSDPSTDDSNADDASPETEKAPTN